jgi:DNA-binding FadR family transcriptional regulator
MVARDICARLHSQVVRFQFRTVLAPGRPPKSLAEHRRIVAAIAAQERPEAEQAMREHLTNVAATLAAVAAPERAASAM